MKKPTKKKYQTFAIVGTFKLRTKMTEVEIGEAIQEFLLTKCADIEARIIAIK